MHPFEEHQQLLARRRFLSGSAMGLGAAALGNLIAQVQAADGNSFAASGDAKTTASANAGLHFPAKAKRVTYCQGTLTATDYGRDHHPRCFSVWMAGGGVKGGFEYGQTDEFSYNIVENPVHVNDMNATILHQLGIDHNRLTFPFLGLDQKLTGVEESHVVHDILA